MCHFKFWVVFFILSVSVGYAQAAEKVVKVLLHSEGKYPVLKISPHAEDGHPNSMKTADCPDFNDVIFKKAFRFEIELAIICTIFRERNLADKFEFIPYPNIKRAVEELRHGRGDLIGESLFSSEVAPEVLFSQPIIALGDFQVGIFTTPNRKNVLSISSAEELRKLRGITVAHWVTDSKTLRGITSSLVTVSRSLLIPRMIKSDRADFTLSYLDKADTSHMGELLVRIDGFRVSLDDTRVLAFSPKNRHIVDEVNEFIRSNRFTKPDRIRESYRLGGFITDRYNDWTHINRP